MHLRPIFKSILLVSFIAHSIQPAAADGNGVRLEMAWQLNGLASPESTALSADGTFLYVSNVNGEADAQDGNGFISRVSLDGQLLEREWATGMDGPKGIVLDGDKLYVADIDDLLVISMQDGSILERVGIEGARFLNDTAIGPDGAILVTDSATGRIHSYLEGETDLWLEHDLLASLNGLLPEPHQLTATTMAGRLLAIDYETRQITVMAEGLGDADGIAAIDDHRYLVSEWPGLMHVVSDDGGHQTIMDSREESIYLNDFLLIGDMLYQPNWEPDRLTAYRVVID